MAYLIICLQINFLKIINKANKSAIILVIIIKGLNNDIKSGSLCSDSLISELISDFLGIKTKIIVKIIIKTNDNIPKVLMR